MHLSLISGIGLVFSGVIAAGVPNSLACRVFPVKAALGIDFRFHAGFEVAVPFHEIDGPGNSLSVRFLVTPKGHRHPPMTFVQRIQVPPLQRRGGGDVKLRGTFDLGEGAYHVDWQMRDHADRVCSSSWEVEAALASKDKQIEVALTPDTVRRTRDDPFLPEPYVRRGEKDSPAKVKVLVNFEPQNPSAAVLSPLDATALVSIVRSLARRAQIGRLALTAVNIRAQAVVYRQGYSERIDFQALGRAVKTLAFGTVEMEHLARRHGEAEFLSSVIRDEAKDDSHPDALIFVGPKILLQSDVSQSDLKSIGGLDYPVFFLSYVRGRQPLPGDTIGHVVKFFDGREYTITSPRDLWNSVTETVSRISQAKQARIAAGL